MSSDDQVRPYHAKDRSSGQEAADAVAAVLKHAAERDQAAHQKPKPKKQPKWMLPLGIQLGVLALYLLIAPPQFVTLNPIEVPDLSSQETSLRVAIWTVAGRIEGFRQDHGRLPEDLTEMGSALKEVQYVRRGTSEYQLVGTVGESAIVYDSSQPDPQFAEAAKERYSGV